MHRNDTLPRGKSCTCTSCQCPDNAISDKWCTTGNTVENQTGSSDGIPQDSFPGVDDSVDGSRKRRTRTCAATAADFKKSFIINHFLLPKFFAAFKTCAIAPKCGSGPGGWSLTARGKNQRTGKSLGRASGLFSDGLP